MKGMGTVITVNQAAELAGVTPQTIRKWIRDGVIPEQKVMRVGIYYLIDSDGIPPEDKRPRGGRPSKT